jgi:hypothetical protein
MTYGHIVACAEIYARLNSNSHVCCPVIAVTWMNPGISRCHFQLFLLIFQIHTLLE